jgi:hypothetical protein
VRRAELRPQCPNPASPRRAAQPGSRAARSRRSSVVAQQRVGSSPRSAPPSGTASHLPSCWAASLFSETDGRCLPASRWCQVSARGRRRGEGASLSSEAHSPVSADGPVPVGWCPMPPTCLGMAPRHACRATSWRYHLVGDGAAQPHRLQRPARAWGAIEQRDAADEGRLEPCGDIVVGNKVIVNHGEVVRPSQLIASVKRAMR